MNERTRRLLPSIPPPLLLPPAIPASSSSLAIPAAPHRRRPSKTRFSLTRLDPAPPLRLDPDPASNGDLQGNRHGGGGAPASLLGAPPHAPPSPRDPHPGDRPRRLRRHGGVPHGRQRAVDPRQVRRHGPVPGLVLRALRALPHPCPLLRHGQAVPAKEGERVRRDRPGPLPRRLALPAQAPAPRRALRRRLHLRAPPQRVRGRRRVSARCDLGYQGTGDRPDRARRALGLREEGPGEARLRPLRLWPWKKRLCHVCDSGGGGHRRRLEARRGNHPREAEDQDERPAPQDLGRLVQEPRCPEEG